VSPGLSKRASPALTPRPLVCCGTSTHGVSLTGTLHRSQPDATSRQQSSVRYYRARLAYLAAVAASVVWCEVAGMAALVHSYTIAQSTLTSTSEYVWFWIGMFLFELPLAGLLARRATPWAMRTALLIFYGFVSFGPKLLRNPTSPVYHDEFPSWRATYDILGTGKLFRPNPLIPIVGQYPGLNAATAALVHATGLTIWQAATLLLILFHVALVLGIAALAEALGFNNRIASLMAIFYCLNSSFLYFDTEYAYESMGITLAVWTLVAYVRAIRSRPRSGQARWNVLTVVLSAGTLITHHLSTFTLILIMALISVAVSIPWLARKEGWVRTAVTAWSLTLVTSLITGAWFIFVAPATWSYLSPFVGEGLSELMQDVHGSSTTRQLFGASLSPWWEPKAAYLVPVFAAGLAVGGLLLIRARIRDGRLPRGDGRALLSAFAFLGLVYFPSTVFILTPSGAEGARRSWAFTWIGLSMLAGPAAVWLLDWAGRTTHRWTRVSLRSGLVAALAIALVGGTAAGLDSYYRFPGPFRYGSDARSVTPELLAASEWFSARFGTGNNIVTDRYTGLIFASFGAQNTAFVSSKFPIWNLYLAEPGTPSQLSSLLSELHSSNITYLIVDKRMEYELPQLGFYFTTADPATLLPEGGKPIFNGRLEKFNTMQWLVKVFQSDSYSIYRINLPITPIGYQQKPPTPPVKHGKLSRSKRGILLQGKLLVAP
jgi:hypothetical protein